MLLDELIGTARALYASWVDTVPENVSVSWTSVRDEHRICIGADLEGKGVDLTTSILVAGYRLLACVYESGRGDLELASKLAELLAHIGEALGEEDALTEPINEVHA